MGVTALFLSMMDLSATTIAASLITTSASAHFSTPEGRFADRTAMAACKPSEEPLSGISMAALSEPADFLPPPIDAVQFAQPPKVNAGMEDFPVTARKESPGPTLFSRLADLSMERHIWLLAFTPWIWGVLIWQVQPPQRFRSRRRKPKRHWGFLQSAILRSTAAIRRS